MGCRHRVCVFFGLQTLPFLQLPPLKADKLLVFPIFNDATVVDTLAGYFHDVMLYSLSPAARCCPEVLASHTALCNIVL